MRVREPLTTLAAIHETVLLYPGQRGHPRAQRILTDTTPTQDRLYEIFDLATYAPAAETWVIHAPPHHTHPDQRRHPPPAR